MQHYDIIYEREELHKQLDKDRLDAQVDAAIKILEVHIAQGIVTSINRFGAPQYRMDCKDYHVYYRLEESIHALGGKEQLSKAINKLYK